MPLQLLGLMMHRLINRFTISEDSQLTPLVHSALG